MKTLTVGEFKTHFAEVIEDIKKGTKVAVTYGKKKQVVGYFVPSNAISKNKKRPLGILNKKAQAIFKDDFKLSEEEFLGL